MDAARVYERYLRARRRAERLKHIALESNESLKQSKIYDRLRGGRFTDSNNTSPVSFIPTPVNIVKAENCTCGVPPPSCPEKLSNEKEPARAKEVTQSKAKDDVDREKSQEKSKSKTKYICKCKLPVIVVPSKRSLENGSTSKTRFRCCLFREKSTPKKVPQEIPKTSEAVPKETPKCPPNQNLPPVNKVPIPIANTKSKECVKSVRYKSTETETDLPQPCAKCEKIPEITQELCELKRKLELQIEQEIDQKQKLNAMNDQLKKLCECVHSLSDKYKTLETAKEALLKDTPKEKPEQTNNCQEKSATMKTSKGDVTLERKPSSLCEFCKNKNLPVINTMQLSLFKLMGNRCFDDIALTILLRADNVYHVNVRDISNGSVLGCLLVTDAGIKEASNMGLFQEILTFCVIDVRNTINAKDSLFGGINFEFVHDERLTGGNTLSETTQEQACEEEEEAYESDCYQDDAQESNDFDYGPIEAPESYVQSEIADEFQPEVQYDSATSVNKVIDSGHPVAKTISVTSTRQNTKLKKNRKPKMSNSEVLREINTYSSSLVLTDLETQYPVRSIKISSLMNYPSSDSDELEDDDVDEDDEFPITAEHAKF